VLLGASERGKQPSSQQPTAGKQRSGLKSGLFGIRLFCVHLLPRSEAPSSAVQGGAREARFVN
jgi:hypothetical protein